MTRFELVANGSPAIHGNYLLVVTTQPETSAAPGTSVGGVVHAIDLDVTKLESGVEHLKYVWGLRTVLGQASRAAGALMVKPERFRGTKWPRLLHQASRYEPSIVWRTAKGKAKQGISFQLTIAAVYTVGVQVEDRTATLEETVRKLRAEKAAVNDALAAILRSERYDVRRLG